MRHNRGAKRDIRSGTANKEPAEAPGAQDNEPCFRDALLFFFFLQSAWVGEKAEAGRVVNTRGLIRSAGTEWYALWPPFFARIKTVLLYVPLVYSSSSRARLSGDKAITEAGFYFG